jgi:hypothetical protein
MPIKSKAQRRKFAQLLMEGKITPETFEEWNRGAGSKRLPERLHPKRSAKARRKTGRPSRGGAKRGPKRVASRTRKSGTRSSKRRS